MVSRASGHVVLVASPLAVLRRRYADGLGGSVPVLEATDRAELSEHLVSTHPAVVFLDLALPGLGGLGGIAAIRRLNPAVKIVLLADVPNERDAVFALVVGARGYCARSLDPALIRKAAEVVQRGEVWIGRHVIPHLLRRLTSLNRRGARAPAGAPPVFDFLAPREREIALLVGAGANNREIALRLNISEATVKAHLTSVYRKLKVTDRLRLALFVAKRRAQSVRGRRRLTSPGPGATRVEER